MKRRHKRRRSNKRIRQREAIERREATALKLYIAELRLVPSSVTVQAAALMRSCCANKKAAPS